MKKFILFLVLAVFLSSPTMAQRRYSNRRSSSNTQTFRFTEDMVRRIKNNCPNTLKRAQNKRSLKLLFFSIQFYYYLLYIF